MIEPRRTTISLLLVLLLCGCNSATPINEIPMYGGVQTDPSLQKADEEFISSMTKTFGTREKASDDSARLGWHYFYQNDVSTAMKRFNQAWLLNTNNADAYWGFGIIIGQQAQRSDTEQRLKQSVTFLETANVMKPQNARIMTDLAYSHTMIGAAVLKRQHRPGADDEFAKAQALFENAMKIEPTYPLLYYNWSVLEFYRGDYPNAKAKLDEAVHLGFTPPPGYVKDVNRLKDKNNKIKK